MRMLMLSLIAGGALAFSSAAFAADTTAAPQPAAATTTTTSSPAVTQPQSMAPLTTGTPMSSTATASTEDPNEIVCKQQGATTGTRLGASRVCRKRSEWAAAQKQSQEYLNSQQKAGLQFNPKGS